MSPPKNSKISILYNPIITLLCKSGTPNISANEFVPTPELPNEIHPNVLEIRFNTKICDFKSIHEISSFNIQNRCDEEWKFFIPYALKLNK
jgi:hypothetical protein